MEKKKEDSEESKTTVGSMIAYSLIHIFFALLVLKTIYNAAFPLNIFLLLWLLWLIFS